jgi:uncharacterized protein YndB with AHSA1/START domain
MLSSKVVNLQEDHVLRIRRYFEAPPELLFRLWADPVHRVRWWGPTAWPSAVARRIFASAASGPSQ